MLGKSQYNFFLPFLANVTSPFSFACFSLRKMKKAMKSKEMMQMMMMKTQMMMKWSKVSSRTRLVPRCMKKDLTEAPFRLGARSWVPCLGIKWT